MAQFARPDGDTTLNSWESYTTPATTDLFEDINESTADNADYILSGNNSNDAYTGTLSNGIALTPGAGTQTARYRYSKSASAGHTVNITVELLEGATVRGSATHNGISDAWTDGSFTVTGITNYDNLNVRFTRGGDTGGSPGGRRSARISWFEFETPDGVVTLAAQDADHAHTVDNTTLTQDHQLVLQEATHSHAADNATLTSELANPTGVTYTPGVEEVQIDWTSATSPVTHTRVYRGVASGRLEQIAQLAIATETYTDSNLTPGLPYIYQLRSWDGAQESPGTTETTERPTEGRTVWRRIETDGGAVGSAVFTVYDEGDVLLNTYTDNSPASTSGLKAAIDAYKATNRWFKFGPGTFNFLNGTSGEENATFNTLNNMRFTGSGMDGESVTVIANSSTDAGTDTEPLSFTNCDNIIVEHLEISAGGSSNTTSDGLDFDNADHCHIHHVHISATRARALIFDGKDGGAQATLNVVEDVLATSSQTTQGDVLELLGAKRNVFRRVWAYAGGERGMQLNQGGTSVTSDDNVIEDSNFTRNNEDGIEVLSGLRNIIRRNHVEGNDQSGGSHDGIELAGSVSLPSDDNEILENWTSDVQVTKTQSYGVEVDADANDNIVNNNYWGGNDTGTINDAGTNTSTSGNVTTETTFAPTPPVALWAEEVGSDIILRWYDPPANDLDDLTIYRGANRDSLSSLVASHTKASSTNPADATTFLNTYTDAGASGSGYAYAVTANDTDGNESLQSNIVETESGNRWGVKTTLSSTELRWGPYRATTGDYYAFAKVNDTLQAYKSATLTGTYVTAGSAQDMGLGNDGTSNEHQAAWSYADDEFHAVVIDAYAGGVSGWLADTHGLRFDPSTDTWSSAAIGTGYEIDIAFAFGIDVAYDEGESGGKPYFSLTGPMEDVSSTLYRRNYAARWNGTSWDWFNAGDSGTTTVEAPQGSVSGATRAYVQSGQSSASSTYAVDSGARASTAETTDTDEMHEGPGVSFDGSAFNANDETLGSILQRTEGDPPGAATSKTPFGWGTSEFPTGWTVMEFDGELFAVAYNTTDQDISYSTLASAAGTWAAAKDIDRSAATYTRQRLLKVDTDDDGSNEKLWLVYWDGTNTVYREWGGTLVTGVTLASAAADHAHTADNVTLTQTHVLALQEATHALSDDGGSLTQTHTLSVAEASHAHTADNVDLTHTHVIDGQEATHSHTVDNTALTQTHVIASAESTHGHTADNVTLTTTETVDGNEATHAHTADNVVLTQTHVLAVQGATHAHTAGSSELTHTHALVVQEASHGHTVDNTTLTQTHVLANDEATHAHTVDTGPLTQTHILDVQEASHGHTADNTSLTEKFTVVPQDATHGHTADNVTLAQTHVLAIESATHGHTAAVGNLTQYHTLTGDEATHALTDAAIVLTQTHQLVAAPATHGHTVDAGSLTQTHVLGSDEALHGHTVDPSTLTHTHVLGIDEAAHSHTADNVTLVSDVGIVLQDSDHAHTADVVTLTQTHILALQDATHSHAADTTTVDDGTAPPPFSSIFVPMLLRRRR